MEIDGSPEVEWLKMDGHLRNFETENVSAEESSYLYAFKFDSNFVSLNQTVRGVFIVNHLAKTDNFAKLWSFQIFKMMYVVFFMST